MYRVLLFFVGVVALAMGEAGLVLALSGRGVVHFVMEGIRGVFFGLCGIALVAAAVKCDAEFARTTLRELRRDIFSRRNLAEFVLFWLVIAVAVLVMLMLRP